MQQHYRNALKLEQQGFISKGQRMQFEVARNNAERAQQNAQANLNAALFQLNNLLLDSNITELSTPLFVNRAEPQNVNILLSSFSQNSPLIKKCRWIPSWPKPMSKPSRPLKGQMFCVW